MTSQPHNLEAERSVLGACLIDRDAIIAVASIIGPDDFYAAAHHRIYQAILDLYYDHTPTDLVTVVDYLASHRLLTSVGGEVYLAELIGDTPTSVHAAYYAKIVGGHALRRRMIQAGQEIVKASFSTDTSIDDLILTAESRVEEAMSGRVLGLTESIGAVLDGYVDTLDDGPPTFRTFGHRRLDDMLGGMEPGGVTIVAGRPSHGKTGFAFGVGMHTAERGQGNTLVISLEMTNRQMVHRALSMRTGMDSRKIRARHFVDDERWIVEQAARQIHHWPLEFSGAWGTEVMTICNQVRSYHAARGLDLLIIDGLWLMSWAGAKGNRVQEVGKVSRMMKQLALDLELPILLCHQLNRASTRRADPSPILSDLRESGDVEQDADVVIFIDRPGLHDVTGMESKAYANVIVAKNRQGPTGRIVMRFDEITTSFHDSAPRGITP